jgi:predicted ATPase
VKNAKPLKLTYNIVSKYGLGKTTTKEAFAWQCAFAEAGGKHVVHSFIWDCLSGYFEKDPSYNYKLYSTEEDAMYDLKCALSTIRKGLESYD